MLTHLFQPIEIAAADFRCQPARIQTSDASVLGTAIAIKVTTPLSPDPLQTKNDLFRLAIIRDGARLLIVEEHETVTSPDDPPRISDAEFTDIVRTAASRLDP